ncbi:hypothetical protein ACSBR1_016998 [Camellia fascicularis]
MGLSSHQQSLFHGLIESTRKQLPKLVVGSLLIGAGIAFYTNRVERINQLFLQPDIVTAGIDEVSSNTKPLIRQIRKLPKRVKKLMEMIPHQEVNEEEASLFDMSWLLFASVIYVLVTAVVVGLVSCFIAGQPSPAAIIIGNGLALSPLLLSFRYCRNEVRACHEMDELHFVFCFPGFGCCGSADTHTSYFTEFI